MRLPARLGTRIWQVRFALATNLTLLHEPLLSSDEHGDHPEVRTAPIALHGHLLSRPHCRLPLLGGHGMPLSTATILFVCAQQTS